MQATGRGGDLMDPQSIRPHSMQPHKVFVLEDPTIKEKNIENHPALNPNWIFQKILE